MKNPGDPINAPSDQASVPAIVAGALGLWLFSTFLFAAVLIGAACSFVMWLVITPIRAVAALVRPKAGGRER